MPEQKVDLNYTLYKG